MYRGVGAGHARPANCRKRCTPPAGGGGKKCAATRNVSGPDCQKTLVGASIARPCPFALQENRPGKCVAAVSWRATNGRPYTRNKAGMQFFDGLRSGQDRSLQISRQRCGGYNKVGGNKKSHHGRWWDFLIPQSLVISQH